MAKGFRTVLVDWVDGHSSDTDEVRVFADSDGEAIQKATKKWRMTIGAEWPHCRIEKVEILTPARRREFA